LLRVEHAYLFHCVLLAADEDTAAVAGRRVYNPMVVLV
jgi:hypothetical protein